MPSQIDSSSQDSHSSSQDSDSEKIKIKSEIKQVDAATVVCVNTVRCASFLHLCQVLKKYDVQQQKMLCY